MQIQRRNQALTVHTLLIYDVAELIPKFTVSIFVLLAFKIFGGRGINRNMARTPHEVATLATGIQLADQSIQ